MRLTLRRIASNWMTKNLMTFDELVDQDFSGLPISACWATGQPIAQDILIDEVAELSIATPGPTGDREFKNVNIYKNLEVS